MAQASQRTGKIEKNAPKMAYQEVKMAFLDPEPPEPDYTEPQIEVIRMHIGRLELRPGDALVIRTRYSFTKNDCERLQECLPERVPIIFLPFDADIAVLYGSHSNQRG
jgi:hypothetical protein